MKQGKHVMFVFYDKITHLSNIIKEQPSLITILCG